MSRRPRHKLPQRSRRPRHKPPKRKLPPPPTQAPSAEAPAEQTAGSGKSSAPAPFESVFEFLVYNHWVAGLQFFGAPQEVGAPPQKPDLQRAQMQIDFLDALQEKTKGNLNAREEKILSEALGELKLTYVQITRS